MQNDRKKLGTDTGSRRMKQTKGLIKRRCLGSWDLVGIVINACVTRQQYDTFHIIHVMSHTHHTSTQVCGGDGDAASHFCEHYAVKDCLCCPSSRIRTH